MGFSQDQGYIPIDIAQIMDEFRGYINTQFGTTYTTEQFVGTNLYKYFYAIAQRVSETETKTSEIFLKLQQYFIITNERISRPVVTNPGVIEKLTTEGYVASLKPIVEADAGKINICIDTDETADDYATTKLDICTIIKDSTPAGCVSQGTETESIVLSNGQSFDFKFHLPNRIPIILRLTTELSENNQVVIESPDDVKLSLLTKINALYKLGKNFEPQRYFTIVDAPWAASVLLEWSDDDGDNWHDEVYDSDFDDLFEFGLEDITLVEN